MGENFWLLLADPVSNDIWMSQKVYFMDGTVALVVASKVIQEIKECHGGSLKEPNVAMSEEVKKEKWIKTGNYFMLQRKGPSKHKIEGYKKVLSRAMGRVDGRSLSLVIAF